MQRNGWSSTQQGAIRLENEELDKGPKRKIPVPKGALEDGLLQLLASAAEMQQRQDLDSALQLYQAAMAKVKEHGLDRKRLFMGTNKKPAPLNVKTPLEWSLHVGDMASAVCLLGNANLALAGLRKRLSFERLEQLLNAGANIDYRIGPSGRTLLLAETADGRRAGVRAALDHGASINCMDDNGDTALALALASGLPQAGQIIKELLDAGADLNARNGEDKPLFEVAMANAQPDVLKQIMTELSPLTAEHREQMQAWAARSLVRQKVWSKRTCEVLILLLNYGLDPDVRSHDPPKGRVTSSLLNMAMQRHADELVIALLEKGVELDLDTALLHGSPRVLDLMLTKLTPLSDAHHQDMIEWIKRLPAKSSSWRDHDIKVLRILLDFGLSPDLRRHVVPHSPLVMCAVSAGNNALLQKLIAHKAKLDVKDDQGNTPLICAAQNNHREVYDTLKAAGLNDSYFLFGTVWGNYSRG
ncbi:hypothetical protein MMC21_002621 [Puttea exsequens]|nr:hypothetical protein [Puttea exsequens]